MKKSGNKICLVHFQPLEYYPPAMNLINSLASAFNNNILILTTYPTTEQKLFSPDNVTIHRYGKQANHYLLRYIFYLQFNLMSLIYLFVKRLHKIVCIETLSILPVYVYLYFFPRTKLFLHFHEYTSLEELERASSYFKFLYYLENKLYPKADWISHTNKDRLQLFKEDHPNINFKRLEVMANYPPSSWLEKSINRTITDRPIKVVYIGAFSNETMYVQEFANWVLKQNGRVLWVIYSNNFNASTKEHISKLKTDYINFYNAVEYDLLPDILKNYDVGVILYRGIIPNHIFSIPNKLFEYLACGLDVWYPKELLSCNAYKTVNNYPKVIGMDFNKLDNLNLTDVINKQNLTYHPFTDTCELELKRLVDSINAQ